jgi:hypothetical protein
VTIVAQGRFKRRQLLAAGLNFAGLQAPGLTRKISAIVLIWIKQRGGVENFQPLVATVFGANTNG